MNAYVEEANRQLKKMGLSKLSLETDCAGRLILMKQQTFDVDIRQIETFYRQLRNKRLKKQLADILEYNKLMIEKKCTTQFNSKMMLNYTEGADSAHLFFHWGFKDMKKKKEYKDELLYPILNRMGLEAEVSKIKLKAIFSERDAANEFVQAVSLAGKKVDPLREDIASDLSERISKITATLPSIID